MKCRFFFTLQDFHLPSLEWAITRLDLDQEECHSPALVIRLSKEVFRVMPTTRQVSYKANPFHEVKQI